MMFLRLSPEFFSPRKKMSPKLKQNVSQLLSDQGSDSSPASIGRLPVTNKVGLETEKVYTVVSRVHVTHTVTHSN